MWDIPWIYHGYTPVVQLCLSQQLTVLGCTKYDWWLRQALPKSLASGSYVVAAARGPKCSTRIRLRPPIYGIFDFEKLDNSNHRWILGRNWHVFDSPLSPLWTDIVFFFSQWFFVSKHHFPRFPSWDWRLFFGNKQPVSRWHLWGSGQPGERCWLQDGPDGRPAGWRRRGPLEFFTGHLEVGRWPSCSRVCTDFCLAVPLNSQVFASQKSAFWDYTPFLLLPSSVPGSSAALHRIQEDTWHYTFKEAWSD